MKGIIKTLVEKSFCNNPESDVGNAKESKQAVCSCRSDETAPFVDGHSRTHHSHSHTRPPDDDGGLADMADVADVVVVVVYTLMKAVVVVGHTSTADDDDMLVGVVEVQVGSCGFPQLFLFETASQNPVEVGTHALACAVQSDNLIQKASCCWEPW
jgi:hypothetical protein